VSFKADETLSLLDVIIFEWEPSSTLQSTLLTNFMKFGEFS